MKNKGIGFKLTAVMVCIILLGILITVGTAMIIANNTITSETLQKLRSETSRQALVLDEWLIYQKATVSALAPALAQMDDHSEENLRKIFSAVLNANDVYQDVYMGFPDNTAIMGSGFPIENEYDWWRATERAWYKVAMVDTNVAGITSLYIDVATGDLCITVAHAVKRDGVVLGVVGIDILVNVLQDIVVAADLGGTGYSFLIDSDGDILIHPNPNFAPNSKGEFNNLSTVMGGVYTDLWNKVSASDGVYKYRDSENLQKYYSASTLKNTNWIMLTVLPENVVTQPIRTLILYVVLITVAILIIASVLIYIFVTGMITKPLTALSAFMKKAGSTGDISLSPEDVNVINKLAQKPDEMGHAISGSAAFVGHVTHISKELETIANGDLTADIKPLSDVDVMGKTMKQMLNQLNKMFTDIQASTYQVSTGSKQVADGAQILAQGSTEQAASIQQLSSSITEIAERTKINASTADKTASLSATIKESAEKGSQQMDDMISAVGEINDASKNIRKIIKTIDDIAFQTNILALNAAVEAARAGQHGKGFAVVAEEVRNLASKSAEAAKDTGNMIQNSMEKAELGSRIAGATAESLKEIVEGINESSQLIAEIAGASEQQSVGIEQINTGIDQVAQVVQQNSATAEQSAAASVEMSNQSAILQDLIAHFKLRDSGGMNRGLPSADMSSRTKHIEQNTHYNALPNDDGSFGKY